MTENSSLKDTSNMKKAWIIYALIILLVVLALVFIVADDNEEKLFFSLMTVAAAYVFRPTDRFMKRKIAQFTGSAEDKDAK